MPIQMIDYKKQFSLKLSLFLLLLTLFALAGCGGAEERKAAYLERGHALLEEGNYEKAQLEFKNALQIDPKDVDAHYQLGLILEKLGELRPAMSQFLAAVKLDENHVEARIHAGQLYLVGDAIDLAQEQAEAALKLDDNNPSALALMGGIKAKSGDLTGAFTDGLAALKLEPTHVNSIALVSSLHLAKNDPDKALALINAGVDAHPENMNLLNLKAKILANQKDMEGAGEILEKIISLEPKLLAHRIQLARFYLGQKKLPETEQTLRDAMTLEGDDGSQAGLMLIEFLAKFRSPDEAKAELLKQVEAHPDDASLKFGLAALYRPTDINKTVEILEEVAEEMKYESSEQLKAQSQLALVYMSEQNFDEARRYAEGVLSENPKDPDALTVRGSLALMDKSPTAAIADFRAVVGTYPDAVKQLRLLGRAHIMNKEPELAREALERAAEAAPRDPLVRSELAEVLLRLDKPDLAIEQVQQVLGIAPDNEAALETLFRLQSAKKDWKSALDTAEKIKKAFPDSATGYEFSGFATQMDQGFESSVNEYTAALEKSPDSTQALAQLVQGYLAQDKADEALKRVDEAIARNPENYIALNMKAEIVMAQGDLTGARKIFRDVIKIKPDFRTPYVRISRSYVLEKQPEKMVDVYKAGLQAIPDDPVLVTGLASAYEAIGDVDNAVLLYKKILSEREGALLAINNLAMLYADHFDDPTTLEEAEQMVAKLAETKNPAFMDTVGWVKYKVGKYDEAVRFLNEAVLNAPDQPILQYHLGMAYLKSGNTILAKDHLRKALDSRIGFGDRDNAQAAFDSL